MTTQTVVTFTLSDKAIAVLSDNRKAEDQLRKAEERSSNSRTATAEALIAELGSDAVTLMSSPEKDKAGEPVQLPDGVYTREQVYAGIREASFMFLPAADRDALKRDKAEISQLPPAKRKAINDRRAKARRTASATIGNWRKTVANYQTAQRATEEAIAFATQEAEKAGEDVATAIEQVRASRGVYKPRQPKTLLERTREIVAAELKRYRDAEGDALPPKAQDIINAYVKLEELIK